MFCSASSECFSAFPDTYSILFHSSAWCNGSPLLLPLSGKSQRYSWDDSWVQKTCLTCEIFGRFRFHPTLAKECPPCSCFGTELLLREPIAPDFFSIHAWFHMFKCSFRLLFQVYPGKSSLMTSSLSCTRIASEHCFLDSLSFPRKSVHDCWPHILLCA